MSILQMSLSIPVTPNSLSSAEALSGGPLSARSLCFTPKLTQLSLTIPLSLPYKTTPIRMGGGPRTFPGGVSKWQWKKMQAKKAKQLLRARLARERQIYEMRKRAELKADIFELERPWEAVEKPPNLFSVGADEQLKVLADRFQKPGGLDLWSERDGPELFRHDNGLPSARFFPKGVVHSIKPYRKTDELAPPSEELWSSGLEEDLNPSQISEKVGKLDLRGNGNSRSNQSGSGNARNVTNRGTSSFNGVGKQNENRNFKGKGSTRTYSSDSEGKNYGNARFHNRDDRRNGYKGDQSMNSEGKNFGNARFVDRDDRRNRRPGENSGEFRSSNGYKSDQSMNSEGKNYGNARFLDRDDRRSRGPGDNSGEFRRSNDYKRDQSMKSEGKNYGNARFHNTDDRRSGRQSDSSAEFRRSISYKKDQSMNSDGNAKFHTRDDRRSRNPGNSSGEFRRSNSYKKSEVFDLNLHNDGSYGFELGNIDDAIDSAYLGR